jgi:ribosomal protein S1
MPVNWGSLMVQLSAMGLNGAASDAHRYAVEEDAARRREESERRAAERREYEERRRRGERIEKAWESIETVLPQGTIVSARVVKVAKVGAVVAFDLFTGVIPTELVDEPAPQTGAGDLRVGHTLDCVVIDADPGNRLVVLATRRCVEKRMPAEER